LESCSTGPRRTSLLALFALALAPGGCDDTLYFAGDPTAQGAEAGSDDAGAPGDDAATADAREASAEGGHAAAGCVTDTDCKLSGLRCDRVSGDCVPCLVDTDCNADAGTPRCDSALNRCVQCGLPSDCPPVDVCEVSSHSCLHTCSASRACSQSYSHCDIARGWCVQCTTNADCVHPWDRRICNVTSGQCVQCVSDPDCPSNRPRCDRSVGRCVECLAQTDCLAGQICDPEGSACIPAP
jgi:hypothetical protein